MRRPLSGPARVAIAAVVLVDLVVLGADLFLLRNVSSTTVVNLDDALVDFRNVAGPSITVTSARADGAEVTAPTVPTTGVPVVAVDPSPSATEPATTAPPPAPAFTAPAEGVYHYRTSGGETISVLGARHTYPADTYAVVRHTGGCGWEVRAEVVREHVDLRRMCSGVDALLQLVQSREVEFFGTRDGGTYTCRPPQVQHAAGDAAGAVTSVDCDDGKGSIARLVRTTVGTGQITVGGVTIDVIRLRVDGTLTGRVRGTSVDQLTVVAATGLPVVWDRSVDTVADAFGTSVRYQEAARFDLASLTPAT